MPTSKDFTTKEPVVRLCSEDNRECYVRVTSVRFEVRTTDVEHSSRKRFLRSTR
ncbi:MAG: hypothetical protein JWR14_6109 [Caballeronia sp.]|jgi:hypothetical protein|nr:hypothetical protein [Caballeronia sp.]